MITRLYDRLEAVESSMTLKYLLRHRGAFHGLITRVLEQLGGKVYEKYHNDSYYLERYTPSAIPSFQPNCDRPILYRFNKT